MTHTIDVAKLPAPAQKLLSAQAPANLRMLAARGIVPGLRPDALLAVLVALSQDAAPELSAQAQSTLRSLPEPLLQGALGTELQPAVAATLVEHNLDRPDVLAALLNMASLPVEAVEHVAQYGSEAATELVATNQERVLAHPRLIELLYLNKATRMSTADRLIELAVRHGIELRGLDAWKEIAQAIGGELIAEPSDEPLPEDELFWETDALASELTDGGLDDAYIEDEEGDERLDDMLVPLYKRIGDMSVSQKIRRAMLGSKEERMMLVREHNRIVAAAAARSPLMQEPEVVQITRNRGISEDVLRIIGSSPEWLKSYQIKRNLVENSKTPITIAQRLISQLREADLRRLARNKNISSAVQLAARRHLSRRKN